MKEFTLCGSPPGTRCASDTRGAQQQTCDAYWTAHPDGIDIDPMSNADATLVAETPDVRRAQEVFDQVRADQQSTLNALALEEKRAADLLAEIECGTASAATVQEWRATAARMSDLRRDRDEREHGAQEARDALNRTRAFAMNKTSLRDVADESAANVQRADKADEAAGMAVARIESTISHSDFKRKQAHQRLDALTGDSSKDDVVELSRQISAHTARISELEALLPAAQAERARTKRELNRALGRFEVDLQGTHDELKRSSGYHEALGKHRAAVAAWREAEARLQARGDSEDVEALVRANDDAYDAAQFSRGVFEREVDSGADRHALLRTASRRLIQRVADSLPDVTGGVRINLL